MARVLLARMVITHRYFDPLGLATYREMFHEQTQAVWLESPGSLTMEVCDVPALAAIARDKVAVTLIDNTWATPIGFTAIEHGCDIPVMHLSKLVGGTSDLLMGYAWADRPSTA